MLLQLSRTLMHKVCPKLFLLLRLFLCVCFTWLMEKRLCYYDWVHPQLSSFSSSPCIQWPMRVNLFSVLLLA